MAAASRTAVTSQWSRRSARARHRTWRASVRRASAVGGQGDQLGAAVVGVGAPLDQAEPVQPGQLAADDGGVDGELGGDVARADAAVGRDDAEGDDVAPGQVVGEVGPVAAARLERPAEPDQGVEEAGDGRGALTVDRERGDSG